MNDIGPMLKNCPIKKLDSYIPRMMAAAKSRRWLDLALEAKAYHHR
jgi:hypothetical protein